MLDGQVQRNPSGQTEQNTNDHILAQFVPTDDIRIYAVHQDNKNDDIRKVLK
jgi:hypothetical protein